MPRSHHLILTVDYEVFGNGSGCVQHCVCAPLERMARVVEAYGGRLEIFVEALEFAAMERSPGHAEAIAAVKQQLSDMLRRGHGLQLHVHPQWDGADFNGKDWELGPVTWRTGDVGREQLADMIETARLWLAQAVREAAQDYSPMVFRAGGWCIQPSHDVVPVLRAMGMQADSSVAPGLSNHAATTWYDFRRSPARPWWPIDVDVERVGNGNFLEVPIATGRINPVSHLRSRFTRRQTGELAPGCSGTYRGRSGAISRLAGLLRKASKARRAMLDYCTLPASLMIDVMRDWVGRFDETGAAIPVVAIGHTKNFSPEAEKELKALLQWVSETEGFELSSYQRWHETVTGVKNYQERFPVHGDRRQQRSATSGAGAM